MKKLSVIILLAAMMTVLPKPKDQKLTAMPTVKFTRAGKASWYSKKSPGINLHTANNEIFDDTAMTCAMWGVQFGSRIRVTNLANGKSIVVRVNDRGPHARFVRKGRIIDLTKAAYKKLGAPESGLLSVEIEFL